MAELTPEEREKIYLEEKARVEAQERLKAERGETPQEKRERLKQATVALNSAGNSCMCLGCLILLIPLAIVLLSAVFGGGKPTP